MTSQETPTTIDLLLIKGDESIEELDSSDKFAEYITNLQSLRKIKNPTTKKDTPLMKIIKSLDLQRARLYLEKLDNAKQDRD